MDSMSISNYDVLVDPPVAGKTSDYQLAKHKNHVGNNRLQVFLNMNQHSYNTASQNGDLNKCNSIVDKIVGTVCQQCVPRGRFLVSSKNENSVQWNQMDEDTAKAMLHRVLQHAKATVSTKPNVINGSDEGQKRRRRSSLLRRSASESMLGMAAISDKKKLTRKEESMEEPTWKSSANQKLLTPSRMDVILTCKKDALDPNSQSVGNNRLHIMVAMQSSKYRGATIDGKEAVLDDVMQTVNVFWKGRFLVEGSEGHEELSKEDARNALRSIFDLRSGQNKAKGGSLPSPFNSQIPSPTMRNEQSTLPGITAKSSPATPQMTLPTTLHQQSSLTAISSSPAINMPDVSDLRSAAVKSLQRQKQRQTIAHRLENVSRRNLPAMKLTSRETFHSSRTFGGRGPQKRESTVLGKLDASVMEQLVADFDDADCNDDSNPEPLPPTTSNKFGSQFTGGGNSLRDRSRPL